MIAASLVSTRRHAPTQAISEGDDCAGTPDFCADDGGGRIWVGRARPKTGSSRWLADWRPHAPALVAAAAEPPTPTAGNAGRAATAVEEEGDADRALLGLSRRDFGSGGAVRATEPSSIPFCRKREQASGSDKVAGSTRRRSLRSGAGRPRRRALARTPLAERPRRNPIVSGCMPAIRHAMRRRVSGTDQPRAPGLRIGRSCGVCNPSRTRLSKSASRDRLRRRHKAPRPWPAATMPARTMSKGHRAAATR